MMNLTWIEKQWARLRVRLGARAGALLRIQIALIALLLLAVALIWAAAFYELGRNERGALHEAGVRTEVQAHVFAEYSRSTTKRINELILDTRAQWRGDWPAFAELIARRQESIADIAFQVAVIDRAGAMAFSSLARPGDRADLSQREHFLVHKDGAGADRLFISRPLKGKVSGKWSIQFTRPILRDGQFDGVLVVSVEPGLFGGFAEKLRIGGASVITLVRDSGEIMSRYPSIESSYGKVLTRRPFLEPGAAVSGNFRAVASVDGTARIYGYYKLPEYGLSFVVGEAVADVLAPHLAYRRLIFRIAAGVSLFAAFIVVMLLRPLGALDKVRRQLERAKQQADAANRAKSEFLAMMSHEIRTPLTAIMGFAQLLDSSDDGALRADAGQIILRNGQYLLNIINDILDLSKVEAGRLLLERVPFSPLEVVWGIDSMMGAQARSKGIAFHIALDYPFPAQVWGDPTRWKQILFNLCSNAIKFTELGEVRLRLSYEAARAQLCCRVSDTGIGISPEQMAQLFQPFVQADGAIARKYGGTGLGLHLAQQLAGKMGGRISASSELGAGSLFEARIVAAALEGADWIASAPAHATAAPQAGAPAMPRLRGRVLLAEDGPDNRKLIGAFLAQVGLDWEAVENGAQAVERALAEDFDLILMDVQMPVLDGVQATRTLRAAACAAPIVALTANVMAEDVRRYLDSGCTRCVGKPIDFGLLGQCLADLLPPAGAGPDEADEADDADDADDVDDADDYDARFFAEQLGGFAEIRRAFEDGLPERLARLQAGIAARRWDEVGDLVHMLKGSAGSFGYPRVTEMARAIEDALREDDAGRVGELARQLLLLDEVRKLYEREERE